MKKWIKYGLIGSISLIVIILAFIITYFSTPIDRGWEYTCIVGPGFSCEEYLVSSINNITITIRTAQGWPIEVLSLGFPGAGKDCNVIYDPPIKVDDGSTVILSIQDGVNDTICNVGGKGDKFKSDINLVYNITYYETGIQKSKLVEVKGYLKKVTVL